MKKIEITILILVIFLGAFLRLFKLTSSPPSISWDEAAVGYNAWTVSNYGRDEWGKIFPLYFKSFEDDKRPVHIYITSAFIKLFGLSNLTIRLPSAIFGLFSILALYLLTKEIFKSSAIALTAAFLLSISPYNIHFSRFNHEFNFCLFFYELGLLFFFKGVNSNLKFLLLSFLFFGIDLFTYQAALIVVPLTLCLMVALYRKKILENRKILFKSFLILFFFFLTIGLNPPLLGLSRVNQTNFPEQLIKSTNLYKISKNELFGRLEIALAEYKLHFTPDYLFIKGDKNPRLADQISGQFNLIEGIFLALGLTLLATNPTKVGIIVLFWFFIAPLPSSLTPEAPHSARALFLNGSWQIISSLGIYQFLSLFRSKRIKLILVSILTLFSLINVGNYYQKYWKTYPKRYAIEWQYGMKEVVDFVKANPQFGWVYTTDIRSQPYIFYLYYLNSPLNVFRELVEYNESRSRSFNLVNFYDKYHFGDWDIIETKPQEGILYVVTSSQFDGLKYKNKAKIEKTIYYPDNGVSFIIYSAK